MRKTSCGLLLFPRASGWEVIILHASAHQEVYSSSCIDAAIEVSVGSWSIYVLCSVLRCSIIEAEEHLQGLSTLPIPIHRSTLLSKLLANSANRGLPPLRMILPYQRDQKGHPKNGGRPSRKSVNIETKAELLLADIFMLVEPQ